MLVQFVLCIPSSLGLVPGVCPGLLWWQRGILVTSCVVAAPRGCHRPEEPGWPCGPSAFSPGAFRRAGGPSLAALMFVMKALLKCCPSFAFKTSGIVSC